MNMKVNALCSVVIVGMVLAGAVIAAPVLDQEQSMASYGFWFDRDVVRWQEFRPTLPVLEHVDLFIERWGSPGDVGVQVRGEDGVMTLWSGVVPQESILPNGSWISLDIPSVLLVVDEPFRLYVGATEVSADVEDRYFWRGSMVSSYTRGVTSLEPYWPGYDFSFRTYGSAVPAPGALLLGTFGAGLVGWLRRRGIS